MKHILGRAPLGEGSELVKLLFLVHHSQEWDEGVSELMIVKKKNYKKLYTVLSCLGVFTFCTCKILICLTCFVASFKLYFV